MKPELISACQMFLVPSAIMFAALGVAGSEGLKCLVSAMGSVTSAIWWWTIYSWTTPDPGNVTPALWLSGLFFMAWAGCLIVHSSLGRKYGYSRRKDVQWVWNSPTPEASKT